MTVQVPYLQLSTLLAFLKHELRADPILLKYLGRPDNIVSSTLEHDPLVDIESGQAPLFRQEMPCLAIWEHSANRIRASAARRQGLHKRFGEDVLLRMVYVHKVYHGGHGLSPKGLGVRISKLVQWRMREILERHKCDGQDLDFDLHTDGKIESVDMGESVRLGDKDHDGFAAELRMVHYSAPYEEVSPIALQLINVELHLDDVVPAVDGPIVEGDYDVTS